MTFRTEPSDYTRLPSSRTVFTITASGQGRGWEAKAAEGFWRDFTEIDLNDADAILRFVQRRGDPHGLLEQGADTHTGLWHNPAALLGTVARAYEPEDAKGVSRFTTDRQRIKEAERFLVGTDSELLPAIALILDPSGRLALRAKTLAAFMALSAAAAVESRTPMRRCSHCGSWFHLGRTDALFCSGSCRAANHNAHTRKGQTRGEYSQEDQSKRTGGLAKSVARTGTKRPEPAANKKLPERQGRKGPRRKSQARR